MTHLIDKGAVMAEIEKLKENANKRGAIGKVSTIVLCNELLSFIDTLEVKDVDLDEEADNYWGTLTSDVRNSIYLNDFYKIAKHFFELGLKAQKL